MDRSIKHCISFTWKWTHRRYERVKVKQAFHLVVIWLLIQQPSRQKKILQEIKYEKIKHFFTAAISRWQHWLFTSIITPRELTTTLLSLKQLWESGNLVSIFYNNHWMTDPKPKGNWILFEGREETKLSVPAPPLPTDIRVHDLIKCESLVPEGHGSSVLFVLESHIVLTHSTR